MKIFQIVKGICEWHTPYKTAGEAVSKYPKQCVFVEAPDYVFEGWIYKTKDDEGNILLGNDRFIKPECPEGYIYDDYTGKFILEEEFAPILAKMKDEKQELNKLLFAKFLNDHPLLYKDNKYYGVTLEDQTEISLNLTQYKIQVEAGLDNPILEWHAAHEASSEWSYDDLTALSVAINQYIYPWFKKMQEYKTLIFSSMTKEELADIKIIYKTEDELLNEETSTEDSSNSAVFNEGNF